MEQIAIYRELKYNNKNEIGLSMIYIGVVRMIDWMAKATPNPC